MNSLEIVSKEHRYYKNMVATEKKYTFACDDYTGDFFIFGTFLNYAEHIIPTVTMTSLVHEELHCALNKIDPIISTKYDKFVWWLSEFVNNLGLETTRGRI